MKRFRNVLAIIALVLLLPCSYAFVVFKAWRGHEAALDEFRTLGYPANQAELDDWLAIDDEASESARQLELVTKQFNRSVLEHLLPFENRACCSYSLFPGYSEEQLKSAGDAVDSHKRLIRHLDALQKSGLKTPAVPSRFANSDEVLMEFYSQTAKLLANGAIVFAERGDSDQAQMYLDYLVWLNGLMDSIPHPEYAGLNYENRRLELSVIEYLLSTSGISNERIQHLDLHIQNFEYRDDLAPMIIAEHASTLSVYEWKEVMSYYLRTDTEESDILNSVENGYLMQHRYFAMRRDYSRRILQLLELSKNVGRPGIALNDIVESAFEDEEQFDFLAFEYSDGWIYNAFYSRIRLIAEHRVALTALQLERYRRHTGGLPNDLEQAVPRFIPEISLDPFSGEPLRYHRWYDSFSIYSVGSDKEDAHIGERQYSVRYCESIEFYSRSERELEAIRARRK